MNAPHTIVTCYSMPPPVLQHIIYVHTHPLTLSHTNSSSSSPPLYYRKMLAPHGRSCRQHGRLLLLIMVVKKSRSFESHVCMPAGHIEAAGRIETGRQIKAERGRPRSKRMNIRASFMQRLPELPNLRTWSVAHWVPSVRASRSCGAESVGSEVSSL